MKLACIQANVVYGNPDANAQNAVAHLETLSEQGIELAIFPEAYLTGYCADTWQEAERIAIELPFDRNGEVKRVPPAVQEVQKACGRLGIHAVLGFAGKNGGELYNGAVLIDPSGQIRLYAKTHLPELGLDKHVRAGDALPVFDTAIGRIGILICFDQRHPEPARVLALNGAEIIVLPTNWPEGAQISAEHTCIARAAENRIFYATCDRAGEENGFKFIGLSKIISPTGKILAAAGSGEEVITAEIDLAEAREKRTVIIPGKYEMDLIGSRRPELYSKISQT